MVHKIETRSWKRTKRVARSTDGFRNGYIGRISVFHLLCKARLVKVTFNTLRTGDADLRFYITTVKEG